MTGGNGRRSRGGMDRFYSPPAMRRQNLLQQHGKQVNLGPGKRVGSGSISESDDGKSVSSSSSTTTTKPEMIKKADNLTNLDRFIEHTTPSVPAQFFSKTSMRELRNLDGEIRPYFVLGDLWEFFKEWSAYGAGVPLLLNGHDSVVQYYVPYLSGIQLYVDPSRPVIGQRRPVEESDADSSRETSSDDSGEFGADGGVHMVQGTSRQQNYTGAIAEGLSRLSLSSTPLTGSSGDENGISSNPGVLVFEYLERNQPYSREPLADKITDLEAQCPALRTYRSCDLTFASWVSVAWYPIYRIPTGPTLQSLDACFLTYHSLSTPLSSTTVDRPNCLTGGGKSPDADLPLRLLLRTFALASYKFKVPFWNFVGDCESSRFNSLLQAADDWLQSRQVHHPDYRFFKSHNPYWR